MVSAIIVRIYFIPFNQAIILIRSPYQADWYQSKGGYGKQMTSIRPGQIDMLSNPPSTCYITADNKLTQLHLNDQT